MGRPSKQDSTLPPYVRVRHGSYHYDRPKVLSQKLCRVADGLPSMHKALGALLESLAIQPAEKGMARLCREWRDLEHRDFGLRRYRPKVRKEYERMLGHIAHWFANFEPHQVKSHHIAKVLDTKFHNKPRTANAYPGPTNCGGATDGTSVTIGQPYTLTCSNDSKNVKVTFPSAGSYLFAVDGSNPASLKLTVEKVPFAASLFVRGLNGDWSDAAGNRMSYLGSGTYRLDRAVAAGPTEFKIASSDWSTVNCGWSSKGQQVTIGTPFTMTCPGSENLNLTAPAAGTDRFTYTKGNNGLLVTGP